MTHTRKPVEPWDTEKAAQLATLVLTSQSDHTGEDESFAETVHNADANISLS